MNINTQEKAITVERWKVFEISCTGKRDGNPFVDATIRGTFCCRQETVEVDGFYDGEGVYKVRFMPSFEEVYTYRIEGSFSGQVYEGSFEVVPACGQNHGMVRVSQTYHFAYEDGTPYYPFGTTCYVWQLQKEETRRQTLDTLKQGYFNKIRFCIFPKHYIYNLHEPTTYPYVGTPVDSTKLTAENFAEFTGRREGNHFDYTYFNVEHFKALDEAVCSLDQLGIEADLILMHPYDRWGFSSMTREQDDLYWNYVMARYAAFKNVWWSFANEYDLMRDKTQKDWERFAEIVCRKDPYRHLRSIHNCGAFYDYNKPWITHCCIQRQSRFLTGELVDEWRERFQKPVIVDEIAYEGNLEFGWGNISAEELVRRFWESACRGGYAGHGETYLWEDGVIWWSHGGVLHGESPSRIRFLREFLQELPAAALSPASFCWDETAACEETRFPEKSCYLFYYGTQRPSFRSFYVDDSTLFKVEIVDTWEMTRTFCGTFCGRFQIALPAKPYILVYLCADRSAE